MTSLSPRRRPLRWARLSLLLCSIASATAWPHGDVTPQPVDTTGLPNLGEAWRSENPFSGNDVAVRIGTSGFNQNCARCHGLEAISGGIAPDLRRLDNDCVGLQDPNLRKSCKAEMDEYFITTVRHGRSRNGAVYMPPFEGVLSQEALWTVKAYLETRREKPMP